MNIIIAGGTGFIGSALVKHMLPRHKITVIGRSREKIQRRFGDAVTAVTWQKLQIQGVSLLMNTDVVINLTGAGIGDKRWSKQRKQEILASRLDSTRTLAQFCAQLGNKSPALFNASATGIYGLQKPTATGLPVAVDETTVIDFNTAADFLSYVGRQWELATRPASDAGVRVVNLRFGVVVDKHGGVIAKLKIPFLLGIGGTIGKGTQPFSWIALTDLLNVVDFLLVRDDISGPINLVAPQCVQQKEFAKIFARVLKRPSILPTPEFLIKIMFGQMGEELLLSGKHVKPKRLLDYGFQFTYPDIYSALNALF